MKKIIIPILLGAAVFATSCEQMLDIPQKGVIDYENYYASDNDAQMALTNMYTSYLMNVASTEGIDNPEQVLLNYSADDILAAGGNAQDHEPFRSFDEFRHDGANTTLKQAYRRYYLSVYNANLVISNFTTENRNGVEPKWKSDFTEQAVAEARVMRAYLHMMLALSWYNPPIIDRIYEYGENPANAESQKQVLDWVISECEKAISSGKLPERTDINDKDATARMSKGFAQFVAGKAAMFNNDPATARKYLGALINEGKYKLIPSEDYWTNFHVSGDGNTEKIFEPNFLEDPDYTNNAWGSGQPIFRGRWMVANVFRWRSASLAGAPMPCFGIDGWGGGAIQPDFAKKFLAHDGDSPRRKACFLTADEWLYEMDWDSSTAMTLEQKKKDPQRGIKDLNGLFSHGPYFEWKHMVFVNPPKFLTGDKEYPSDNVSGLGPGSNQKNFNVARYAEALLLYAEACIGSADEAKGLKALQEVQERSGSGKISQKLTFDDVMEEKQYEMWFESCRFHDLVRWSNQGKIDIEKVYKGIHENVTSAYDAFFTDGEPEHRIYTKPVPVNFNNFQKGKNEYFPYPLDYKNVNPNLHDVFGWAN